MPLKIHLKKLVFCLDFGVHFKFFVTRLNVGSYTINATSNNFAASTVKDVKISIAFVTDQNITLNPTGSEEIVTVNSNDTATQVNTNDQQLSTLINNRKIMDLPLLSRDTSSLVLLAPGTVQSDSRLGGFSVNGSRERNNNFLVDGVDNNDTDVPGILGGIATPNIDATEEFRVITGNFNAEYGRNTGAIVTIATKRGTNDYHGNSYIYYRSDKFASRNFFDVTGKADSLDRKQFGGSIGGSLPYLRFGEGSDVFASGKDKLFFFFNYEGNRSKSGSQQFRSIPTALARTGILNTARYGILDIRPTGANNTTGFYNGTGVNSPFSPTTTQILNLYPLPNYPVNGAISADLPGVFEIYTFGYVARDNVDSIAGRIDYILNDNNTLNFSVNYGKGDYALFPPTFDTFNDESRSPQTGVVYALSLLSNIKSNIINEFRFGTNRANAFFNGTGDSTSSNGLNQAVNTIFRNTGVPVSSFGNENSRNLNLLTPFSSITSFDTQGRITGTTTLGDSLTWVKGDHSLKFGGESRFVYSDGQSNFGRQETIDFNAASVFDGVSYVRDNAGNAINSTATDAGFFINNYLSFLTGLVAFQGQSQFFDKAGRRVPNDLRRYRTTESGVFVQDTWRIRQDLTLNLGVRWDYNTVPYEKDGLLSNLIDQNPSLRAPAGGFVFKTVGKNSDNPDISLWDKDLNNFGPRFGFAYSPGFKGGILGGLFGGPGKSSIRGGYGIFYDRVFTNLFSNTSSNLPFSASVGVQPTTNNENYFLSINQIPRSGTATPTNIAPNVNVALGEVGASAVLFPTSKNNILQDKFATPNSMSWNFGFQREIANSFLFELDYVGTRGINLIRSVNFQLTSVARARALTGANLAFTTNLTTNYRRGSLNTAFSQNGAILIISTGNSSYNSMQARVTKSLESKRFGSGQFQAFYTLSHSIDDAPDALDVGTSDRSLPRDSSGFAGGLYAERGDSSFDARHRFVANFVYGLPLNLENGILDRVLGNWMISGIYQAQTGYPFSIFMNGIDTQGTGLSARARYAFGGNGYANNRNPGNDRIYTGPSRSLFQERGIPADGRQGNVGRSQFRGPKSSKFDFSLIKRIPVNEKMRFTIRADFFNLFNAVNLNIPVANVLDNRFGLSTSAGNARIIQFAGRFDF